VTGERLAASEKSILALFACRAAIRPRVIDGILRRKGPLDMAEKSRQPAPEDFEPLGVSFTIRKHRATLRTVCRWRRTTSRFREQFGLVFSLPHEGQIGSEVPKFCLCFSADP
jgi:hypothetical protein